MARKRKSSGGSGPVYFFVIVATAILAGWVYFDQPWKKGIGRSSGETAPPSRTEPATRGEEAVQQPVARTPEREPMTEPAREVTLEAPAPGTIRIATWNLRRLGSPTETDLKAVAGIIRSCHFDVVALQEIERSGASVVGLVNTLGNPWRSTTLSPESQAGERLGFIYRTDRVQETGSAAILSGATAGLFERSPYVGRFRAGSFDFELVDVHLNLGDVESRYDEADVLAKLVTTLANTQKEKDLIVLGDFNHLTDRPVLHYLESIGWRSIVGQTTNIASTENLDHIVFSAKHTREYSGRTGVVRFDEILFGKSKRAAAAISDHRPVWADFSAASDDD